MRKISQYSKKFKTTVKNLDSYSVTSLTKGGEETTRLKIDPKKRHSKNNTIIGWNIYKNEILTTTLYTKNQTDNE